MIQGLGVGAMSGCGGGFVPPSIVYQTNVKDAVDRTTYNAAAFQGLALGTAGDNRDIIIDVAAITTTGATISSVKIHVPDAATDPTGVTATIVKQQSNASRGVAGIAIATVPAGLTGQVVVVMSSGCNSCSIGISAVYDLTVRNAAAATAGDGTSTQNMSLNLNTQSGDIGIVVGAANDVFTAAPTGYTERFDSTTADGSAQAGGDFTASVAETPRTITLSWSGSGSNPAAAAATFR